MALKIIQLDELSQKNRKELLKRSDLDIASVLPDVRKIIETVRESGDEALVEYTQRFDGAHLRKKDFRVSDREFAAAHDRVDGATLGALQQTARAIRKFHLKQLPKRWWVSTAPGVRAGQLVCPFARVGVYVPGGLASYPSSVLMAAVPARVAGVKEIIVCTPPKKNGSVDAATLVAADLAGVDAVFKVGGAQAIAAMAYGTETIPNVEKIVGPGNIYVAAAKQLVSKDIGIEFVAGPSEILVLADDSADPEYVAADMIAQAEHDPNAAAVLVTTSIELARKVQKSIWKQLEESKRKNIVLESLMKYGYALVVRSLVEAIEFVNDYAPEHLELITRRPESVLKEVRNVGTVFIGQYSPVAAGDFVVGPSHILPTGGEAKRRSGLSVFDFLKLITVQTLNKQGLKRVAKVTEKLAEIENLPGHAQSVRKRLVKNR